MNRETPELDQDGLFVCRDCRLGTLFGLIADTNVLAINTFLQSLVVI